MTVYIKLQEDNAMITLLILFFGLVFFMELFNAFNSNEGE